MAALISLRGITRRFTTGGDAVTVLDDVSLDIEPGEMIAIIGASGSGKSTLMNILGCLDRASAGTYLFGGRDISKLGPDQLAELRREHFGFIFQRYQLLADLDAVENAAMPAIYAGVDGGTRAARARDLLTRLGLEDRLRNRPNALSGGQQQRVSVARALMNGGEVILADEPTGALDSKSGADLMALLKELHGEGHTIIIVTHDPSVAAQTQRIIEIKDGRIIGDRRAEDARVADGRRPDFPHDAGHHHRHRFGGVGCRAGTGHATDRARKHCLDRHQHHQHLSRLRLRRPGSGTHPDAAAGRRRRHCGATLRR
jgi:macrolide transport system ATP-binding/permease protein